MEVVGLVTMYNLDCLTGVFLQLIHIKYVRSTKCDQRGFHLCKISKCARAHGLCCINGWHIFNYMVQSFLVCVVKRSGTEHDDIVAFS